MVSLLCYFVCLVTAVPPRTVAAEAAWHGVHDGGGGWRGVVVTSLYDGWYGYPIRLTRIYDYASDYCYGYGYPYAYSHNVHQFYVAVHGVRRVRDYRSVAAATSGAAKTHAPPSATKTVQPAPADTASPRNVWTPMTVPLSQSPANESPKSDADFQQGLQRAGFVDGDNVSILYRSADSGHCAPQQDLVLSWCARGEGPAADSCRSLCDRYMASHDVVPRCQR